ncbi:MAG: sigma-70 family RNA polymerase sigma factor [Actinomycetota bacterium]
MQVAHPDDGLDREQALASRLTGGDEAAFAELYDLYFDDLYDFASRSLRDRDAAADVVQSTFTKAWISLRKGNVIDNPKGWLFAIARNAIVDLVRARRRSVPVAEPGEADTTFATMEPAPTPEGALRDKELSALVWSAASSLSIEEYTLLDLHVRRDLSSGELAETLRIRKGAVYTRLSRLKDSLEISVTAEVLAKQGRADCQELDALVAAAGSGPVTRALRKDIQRHIKSCPRCEESRKRFLSPLEIFAGLAPVPAFPGLKGDIWNGINREIAGSGGSTAEVARTTQARSATKHATRWAAASMGVAAVVGAVALMVTGGTLAVRDPSDVRSTSHAIGEPSESNVVEIVWSAQDDVRAYSVDWATSSSLPDTEPDLPGDATGVSSPPLTPGSWHFSLRTQGESGEWTSTVHLGPFIITGGDPPTDDELPGDDPDPEVASTRTTKTDESSELLLSLGSLLPPGGGDGGAGPDTDHGDDGAGDGRDGNGNDDGSAPPPVASISDVSVLESDGPMRFTVDLSGPAPRPVSIAFAAEPLTAEPGSDFVAVSSALVIAQGQRSGTIAVPIVDDPSDEPDETVRLVLGDPVGAELGRAAATGTIVDDDEPLVPDLSIADVRVGEAAGVAIFRLLLSQPTTVPVSVRYETRDDLARAGADYVGSSGTAVFPAGATNALVSVPITNDFIIEGDESFNLVLFEPMGLQVLDALGIGTIAEDDLSLPPPEEPPGKDPDPQPSPEPSPERSPGEEEQVPSLTSRM